MNKDENVEKKEKVIVLEVEFELNVCGITKEVVDCGHVDAAAIWSMRCAARELSEGGLTHMSELVVLKRRKMSQKKLHWPQSSPVCQGPRS